MPYIASVDRPALDPSINWLVRDLLAEGFSAAQLNYVYSCLANEYIKHHGLRYAYIKDVQGVFHGAAREFDRVVADAYEAKKEIENGTVWDCLEPPPQELTHDLMESLMIYDGHGQSWMRCDEGDCDLHVTGPGRVYCDNCEAKIDSDFAPKGEI